mgnify:FL=1
MVACRECGAELVDKARLDTGHPLACSGLPLQEYAPRHTLPLDLLLSPDRIGEGDAEADAGAAPPYLAGPLPDEAARAVLAGLRLAGKVREAGSLCHVEGEVAWLDLLFWDLAKLSTYGFCFRQDYHYAPGTHRVVARNRLSTQKRNLVGPWLPARVPPPEQRLRYACYLAHAAERHAGFLFLPFASADEAEAAAQFLRREAMPVVWARFHPDTPEVTVSKEVVFDSAHFLTDHPAKCSNLHGDRYVLHVKVSGRIDPVTGCVLDYGYLKRVVNARVVDRFDHHTLNYETPQSWCRYRGPDMETWQEQGSQPPLGRFTDPALGLSPWREALRPRVTDHARRQARPG